MLPRWCLVHHAWWILYPSSSGCDESSSGPSRFVLLVWQSNSAVGWSHGHNTGQSLMNIWVTAAPRSPHWVQGSPHSSSSPSATKPGLSCCAGVAAWAEGHPQASEKLHLREECPRLKALGWWLHLPCKLYFCTTAALAGSLFDGIKESFSDKPWAKQSSCQSRQAGTRCSLGRRQHSSPTPFLSKHPIPVFPIVSICTQTEISYEDHFRVVFTHESKQDIAADCRVNTFLVVFPSRKCSCIIFLIEWN